MLFYLWIPVKIFLKCRVPLRPGGGGKSLDFFAKKSTKYKKESTGRYNFRERGDTTLDEWQKTKREKIIGGICDHYKN